MLAEIIVVIHILLMVMGVAAADGMGFLMFRVARAGDIAAIRTSYPIFERLGNISTFFFLGGLVFGLIAVFTIGFNPFEPWLLIAYALFLIQVALGVGVVDKWHKTVGRLAQAPDADPNTGELAATLKNRTAQRVALLQTVLVGVFIFDMVVKPFSGRS